MFRRRFGGKPGSHRNMALALFAVFAMGRLTVAQEAAQRKRNPDAEAWIKEQVTAGEAADLRTRWPLEEDRIISAAFLQNLLTSKLSDVEVQRRGVRIYGAVVIEPLDLRYAAVPFPVELRICTFEKPVCMAYSVFSSTLSLRDSNFRTEAHFNSMKVGGSARFEKAAFAGAVDFVGADIGGQLNCDNAEFMSEKHEADFNGMKVGGSAFFRKATFVGGVSLAHGEFLDLILRGTNNEILRISTLDLSRTRIKRELRISDAEIEEFRASSLVVKGPATLTRVSIRKAANLDHAELVSLTLEDVRWPEGPDASFSLAGMTYGHINAGKMPEDFPALLALAEQSSFSASVYSTLEEFLMRQGMQNRADDVFVAYKDRLLRTGPKGFKWFANWILGRVVRHGRSPERAFYACGVVLLVGLVVFWSAGGMQRKKEDEAGTPYNPLWYSLSLLLPFVNLQIEDAWVPKPNRHFALAYIRLHTIAGWILIPVGLAALTGFIR